MTLQELSVEKLKSMAYDCLAQIEAYQRDLKVLNNEISLRNQKMSEEQVVETPVVETAPEVVEAPVEVSVEPSPSATPEEAV